MAKKTFKWKFEVELSVDEIWVADGFNPTPEMVAELFSDNWLDYATEDEFKVKAKVIAKPDAKLVRKA